jgi:hypothetical protein
LGSCPTAQRSPKKATCKSPTERGNKRKAIGIDGRSARFLCAAWIHLHRDSHFLRSPSSRDAYRIVTVRDAPAHYMFLLEGDRRPSLGIVEGCNRRSIWWPNDRLSCVKLLNGTLCANRVEQLLLQKG